MKLVSNLHARVSVSDRLMPASGLRRRSVGAWQKERGRGTWGPLLSLQKTAGNANVSVLLSRSSERTPSGHSVPVQRDKFDTYEKVVGSEYEPGKSREEARGRYQNERKKYEQGGRTARAPMNAALSEILRGVEPIDPSTFDPAAANWEAMIDLLFENFLRYADANWDYSAGGTGSAPVYLVGDGNCGQFATAFVHAVHVLADVLAESGLRANLGSTSGFLLTPQISTVVNTPIGGANSMTGKNHPVGNIAKIVATLTGNTDPDYPGVNRAHFNAHTWVVVSLPGAAAKTYDVLMKYKGNHMTPLSPAGHQFQPVCGDDGKELPGPDGFYRGKYMIEDGLWAQIQRFNEIERTVSKYLDREAVTLRARVAAEKSRWGISKWMWATDPDLVGVCRAVQRWRQEPPELRSLYVRSQAYLRQGGVALLRQCDGIPDIDLRAITG